MDDSVTDQQGTSQLSSSLPIEEQEQLSLRAKRVRFPAMSRADAEAWNRICRPRSSLRFEFEGHTVELTPAATGPVMDGPLRFDLQTGSWLGPLDVDPFVVKRLLQLVDRDLAEHELNEDALLLALEHVLAKPLDHFERECGLRVRARLVSSGGAPFSQPPSDQGLTGNLLPFDFELRVKEKPKGKSKPAREAPGRLRLWVPETRLAEFGAELDRLFPKGRTQLRVGVPISLVAGSCRLPLGQMRGLKAGDTLLVEDMSGPWPSAWLVIGHVQRMPLKVEKRRAIISGSMEAYMSNRNDNRADDGAVDDIEVDVQFELGRARMPLGHLGQMADGSVIPLERDFSSPVEVIVGGRRVGEGEIVDIDGRVGVRLLRFRAS